MLKNGSLYLHFLSVQGLFDNGYRNGLRVGMYYCWRRIIAAAPTICLRKKALIFLF
ncbi:hypothetical protein HMPREF1870_00342 [Bacteroidales bacterium KA00344]|nr:hypothetical protein HMPREF1870_00342 [Bacteroidales bacterium KA00344]